MRFFFFLAFDKRFSNTRPWNLCFLQDFGVRNNAKTCPWPNPDMPCLDWRLFIDRFERVNYTYSNILTFYVKEQTADVGQLRNPILFRMLQHMTAVLFRSQPTILETTRIISIVGRKWQETPLPMRRLVAIGNILDFFLRATLTLLNSPTNFRWSGTSTSASKLIVFVNL